MVPNNNSNNIFNVTIDNNAGPTLDTNAEINSLSIGANTGQNSGLIDNEGFTLTVDQDAANNGVIPLAAGGALVVKGSLANSGELETDFDNNNSSLTPSKVTVGGTLTNSGTLVLDEGGLGTHDTLTAGTFVSAGGVNGLVQIFSGTTLTVTKELDITSGIVEVVGTLNGLNYLNQFTGGTLVLADQTISATPAFNSGAINVGGTLELDGTSLSINGNVANSGYVSTERNYSFLSSNTTDSFNVSGKFRNSGTFFMIQPGNSASFGSLANTGRFDFGGGTTVNLTNQPGGITDIPAGSEWTIDGAFNAGSQNALSNLQSIEGQIDIGNGPTSTPASGTLTISKTGFAQVHGGTNWAIDGNVDNNGALNAGGPLTVSGNFTNEAGASLGIGNVATIGGQLSNAGDVQVGSGGILNTGNALATIDAGSEFDLLGAFNSGGHDGLASLGEIDGALAIANNKALTITPASGALNQAGAFYIGAGTNVTVQGNLINNVTNNSFDTLFSALGLTDYGVLNVTGDLNNQSRISMISIGGVINAGSLENSGSLEDFPSIKNSAINVAGAFTQTGAASITFLANTLLTASTINEDAGFFQVAEFSANALNVGAGGNVDGFYASLGATIAPGTPLPANPTLNITANGALVDDGAVTFAAPAINQSPARPGTVNNAGAVTIGKGGTLDTGGGTYNQSGGTTDVNGTLIAAVDVTGGKLSGSGKIQGSLSVTGGTIQPSDPLSVTGSFTLGPHGIFAENITSGADFGALDVTGAASLAGTLDISLLNNFIPANGEQFVILDAAGGLTGTFAAINGINFGNSNSWSIAYNANEVTLTANTPEPAPLLLFGSGLLGLAMLARKLKFT